MVKIFLAEDEFYALTALKQKIMDLNGNYEIIGTASNGAQALAAMESHMPDILMTDIRMPDMDGMTLISEIRRREFPVIPIIISGYQEFDYAKQAVRLGVQDYLLKPVNPSELKDCLTGCVQRLTQNITRKNMISFLIGDEPFRLEPITGSSSFTVCYIIFGNALTHYDSVIHPSVPALLCERVLTVFEAQRSTKGQIFCFNGIFSNEKVIILENSRQQPARSDYNSIAAALSELSGVYTTVFYLDCNGGSLSRDIQNARKGAVRTMIPGCTQALNQITETAASGEDLNETVELLALLLQQNQPALLCSNVKRLFQEWKKERRPLSVLQSDLIFILNSLKRRFASRKSMDYDSDFFVENLISFSLIDHNYAGSFSQLLLEMFSFPTPSADLSGEQLVSRIEAFFRQNISRNISLEDLACELNVSKVYLCRIFKKYKNTTPIDCFTHMKIERSREMILSFPEMSLREISEAMGFNDVYYFSKVFKKITKTPPSEIRKATTSRQ